MRITINLASKPFTDLGPALRQLRILSGIFALMILALAVGLHFFHAAADKARTRERSIDVQIARVRAEHQSYEAMMAEPGNKSVLDQSRTLNDLFAEKNFSWTLAMEDLETVLPAGVQVTTLDPERDPKSGDITVKLRVLGPRDKSIDLVKNLEHSKRFKEARIVGESLDTGNSQNGEAQPVTASTKVNFDLLAQYILPTDDEMQAIAKKQKKEVPSELPQAQTVAQPRPVQREPLVQQPQMRTPGPVIAPQQNGVRPMRPGSTQPMSSPYGNPPQRLYQRPLPFRQPAQPAQGGQS